MAWFVYWKNSWASVFSNPACHNDNNRGTQEHMIPRTVLPLHINYGTLTMDNQLLTTCTILTQRSKRKGLVCDMGILRYDSNKNVNTLHVFSWHLLSASILSLLAAISALVSLLCGAGLADFIPAISCSSSSADSFFRSSSVSRLRSLSS